MFFLFHTNKVRESFAGPFMISASYEEIYCILKPTQMYYKVLQGPYKLAEQRFGQHLSFPSIRHMHLLHAHCTQPCMGAPDKRSRIKIYLPIACYIFINIQIQYMYSLLISEYATVCRHLSWLYKYFQNHKTD